MSILRDPQKFYRVRFPRFGKIHIARETEDEYFKLCAVINFLAVLRLLKILQSIEATSAGGASGVHPSSGTNVGEDTLRSSGSQNAFRRQHRNFFSGSWRLDRIALRRALGTRRASVRRDSRRGRMDRAGALDWLGLNVRNAIFVLSVAKPLG